MQIISLWKGILWKSLSIFEFLVTYLQLTLIMKEGKKCYTHTNSNINQCAYSSLSVLGESEAEHFGKLRIVLLTTWTCWRNLLDLICVKYIHMIKVLFCTISDTCKEQPWSSAKQRWSPIPQVLPARAH